VRGALSADLTGKLESLLTAEEEYAAATAEPTIGAEDFVRSAQARGWTLAITTNNAPQPVEKYLKIHRWDDIFGGRIFGRRPEDPSLMKPHPDCLRRAMVDLGATPADCLMIGDSRADAEAAGKAMVPFVGFAANDDRAAQLRKAAPAAPVVVGMEPLIAAVRAARAKRPPKG
jgi:HAD superfamily hydrolase (TIGR01509 family)